MLYAAAIILACCLFWGGLTIDQTPLAVLIGAGSGAVFALIAAQRWRVIDREGAPYLGFAALGARVAARALHALAHGARGAQALTGLQRAPAGLARVRDRPTTDEQRLALTQRLAAAPGALVLESDAEGLLIHVQRDDDLDALVRHAVTPAGPRA